MLIIQCLSGWPGLCLFKSMVRDGSPADGRQGICYRERDLIME